MILNGFWPVFFGGMLGPFLVELVKIAAWRDVEKIQSKYGDPLYLLATAALFVVAGIVTAISGVENVSLQHAVQLGVNAPAIVAAYATSADARRKRRAPKGATGEDGNWIGPQGVIPRLTQLLAW